jgi:hypothetical protein
MSLVLKITNPTGSASGGVAANTSRFYQLSDAAYAVTGDNDTTITSAVVGSTTFTAGTLVVKVGHLGRNNTFDELLSS